MAGVTLRVEAEEQEESEAASGGKPKKAYRSRIVKMLRQRVSDLREENANMRQKVVCSPSLCATPRYRPRGVVMGHCPSASLCTVTLYCYSALSVDTVIYIVGSWGVARDASEGRRPQRRPQRRLGRRLEEVAKAVGGRLLSVTNAIEAGTWRQGDGARVGWA